MYVYTNIVYGYNFSDNSVPDIGIELPDIMLEYIREGDLIKTNYSGCSNPMYIGIDVGTFDPVVSTKSIVDVANEVTQKIKTNETEYKKEIIVQIDSVIDDLINESKNYQQDYGFTNDDVIKAIDYFNTLKLDNPSIISIIATS